MPRRLSIATFGAVVFGAIAVIVYLLDDPPIPVWVVGSAALFGAFVCFIDMVVVYVRIREGKTTAP